LLARAGEVRELTVEVEGLDAEVAVSEAAQQEASEQLARAADELENLRNRHHTAALAVANHEKDLERTRERIKALGEAHQGRIAERSDILSEIETLAEERIRIEGSLEEARTGRGQHQRDLDALVLRLGSEGRELNRLETIATERRVEHAGRSEKCDRLRATHERSATAVGETGEWISRRDREIADAETRREELAQTIAVSQERLEVRLREEEVARAANESKREAYEQVASKMGELDEKVREVRNEISTHREQVGAVELSSRELELKLAHLDESMRDKWEVDLASWTPPAIEIETTATPEEAQESAAQQATESTADVGDLSEEAAESEASADDVLPAPNAAREARANAELTLLPVAERKKHLEEVRRKMSSLGEVNLGAIEEHEELSERSRFLTEQKDDLVRTIESLRDTIQRINRTSRRRFNETFEAVSKRFSENFPRLFQGGQASLGLTESEDVLEAGIEIMAMPPGKRLQNVNLLSGGEKTLTAIALLVSVFQVRPSPFFLLDEVDAALDDANVDRFNDLVREMSDSSQFVMITHNKRTIEIGDVLYGITMERKGVSKLVSVEMH
jgi:chromosome segregation protein